MNEHKLGLIARYSRILIIKIIFRSKEDIAWLHTNRGEILKGVFINVDDTPENIYQKISEILATNMFIVHSQIFNVTDKVVDKVDFLALIKVKESLSKSFEESFTINFDINELTLLLKSSSNYDDSFIGLWLGLLKNAFGLFAKKIQEYPEQLCEDDFGKNISKEINKFCITVI